jgi:CIC family chloride channel protein
MVNVLGKYGGPSTSRPAAEGASPQPNILGDARPLSSIRFWIVLSVSGVGSGFGAIALMTLLRGVQHVAWGYRAGDFLTAVDHVSLQHRVLVVTCGGVVCSIALLLMRKLSPWNPGLSAGIWYHSGRLPLLRTIGNAVSSIVIVALGASLGREGAPKELGGALASVVADRFGLPPAQRRLVVACAAGAGIAAVYNVPLGGALFASEVLLGSLTLPIVLPALVASTLATAVSWLALPAQPTYAIPTFSSSTSLLVWAIALGPIAAVFSVGYTRLIAWAKNLKFAGLRTVTVSLAVFGVLGIASMWFPQLLGNGKDLVQLALANHLAIGLIATLLVLKLIATIGCVGTGAPGGLFTPTLTFGALLGGALGHIWNRVWPIPLPGAYAVVGAGAVLAAAMLGPVSAVVFMLELTYRIQGMMVPLIIAAAEAAIVARLLTSKSLYSSDLVGSISRGFGRRRTTPTSFEQILSDEYSTVAASVSLAHVSNELFEDGYDSLYVIDEHGVLLGIVDHTELTRPESLPREATNAGDVALPIASVTSTMSLEDVLMRLSRERRRQLPVLDAKDGVMIGVVNAPRIPDGVTPPR